MFILLLLLACAGTDSGKGDADETADTSDTGATTDTAGGDTGDGDSDTADTGEPSVDDDGDGYGEDDCNDAEASIHPDADETCNGIDDDCDGETDDTPIDAGHWYNDADGDGYGDATTEVEACEAPAGMIADGTDCDDGDPEYIPATPELCDGIDNNCDTLIDDGTAVDAATWYLDADLDGYGNADVWVVYCDGPDDWVLDASDCDDADADMYPGAPETCDGEDDDCDGSVDDGCA